MITRERKVRLRLDMVCEFILGVSRSNLIMTIFLTILTRVMPLFVLWICEFFVFRMILKPVSKKCANFPYQQYLFFSLGKHYKMQKSSKIRKKICFPLRHLKKMVNRTVVQVIKKIFSFCNFTAILMFLNICLI
jgi:hypothetical protein